MRSKTKKNKFFFFPPFFLGGGGIMLYTKKRFISLFGAQHHRIGSFVLVQCSSSIDSGMCFEEVRSSVDLTQPFHEHVVPPRVWYNSHRSLVSVYVLQQYLLFMLRAVDAVLTVNECLLF